MADETLDHEDIEQEAQSDSRELTVEDVRFDTPAVHEASARLTSGLRFEGRAAREDVREKLAGLAP